MISNLSLFKQNLKRNVGNIVLLFILLLIFTLIPALSTYTNIKNFKDISDYMLQNFIYDLNNIPLMLSMQILFIYAIVNGISSFSYFHNSKQVDFYNSLPIKRQGLFFQNYTLGIIKVIPIYLINILILLCTYFFMGFNDYLNFTYIFKSILLNILLYLSIYSIFVFSSLVTGTKLISFLFGSFLMIFPVILKGLYILIAKNEMYNFDFELVEGLMNVLPFSLIQHYFGDFYSYPLYNITIINIILKNCVSIIIFFVLSYYLCLNRKSEKSNCAIAFNSFKKPLKYIVTIIAGIFIGYFFYIIFDTDIFGFIIGAFISVLLICSIIEVIYDFDFKSAIKSWKDNIICFILVVIMFFISLDNPIKASVKVPKLEDIQYVSLNSNEIFESDDIKQKVLDLINDGIEYRKNLKEYEDGPVFNVRLGYKLKNGDVEYLIFRLKNREKFKEVNQYILNSKEHLENELEKLLEIEGNLESIRILNSFGEVEEILDKNEIKKFIDIYKKDLNNISNQDTIQNPLYVIKTNVGNFYIYSNYLETLKYIKENIGLLPKTLDVKDIKYIKLDSIDDTIIKDKKDIEFIINNSKTLLPSGNMVTAYIGNDEENLQKVYLYIDDEDYQKIYDYFKK